MLRAHEAGSRRRIGSLTTCLYAWYFSGSNNWLGTVGVLGRQCGEAHLEHWLMCFSSDGQWHVEWVRVRDLYDVLWPGEYVLCPWPVDTDPSITSDADTNDQGNLNSNLKPTYDLEGDDKEVQASLLDCVRDETSDVQFAEALEYYESDVEHYTVNECVPEDTNLLTYGAESIKSAIQECAREATNHRYCAEETMVWETRPGVKFRLIDVMEDCVVEEPNISEKYAALTYVWGGAPQLQFCDATQSYLTKPGSLRKKAPQASKTILDAISVCRLLGIRYLWVDALCIKQDDSRDKAIQIIRMRQIYASAYLTLVAATGENANASLLAQQVSGNVFSSDNEVLEDTVWNTRAWTYQEGQLSHRKLIFTPSGVYFSCQEKFSEIDEAVIKNCKPKPDREIDTFTRGVASHDRQLSAYYQAVSGFSARELTFQSDLINAFQGILKSFGLKIDGLDNVFHWGLPTCAFDQAICWQTDSHCPSLRRPEYPSWSWLGWRQKVFWVQEHRTTNMQDRTSIMLWYQWSPNFWASPMGQAFGSGYKEEVTDGRSPSNPDHRFPRRIPCAYHDHSIVTKPAFRWGFPTAVMTYAQEKRLKLWGSVARLRVAALEPAQETIHRDIMNEWYEISSPATGFTFGKVKLDPVWRSVQGKELAFMLIDGTREVDDGPMMGTHLMCLDETGYDNTKYEAVAITCQRSMIVKCTAPFSEDEWKNAGANTKMVDLN